MYPIADKRLKKLHNGDVQLELKTQWRDGTRAIILTPGELIEKLVAIIPMPRTHQVRFHGVLAPNSKSRAKVIPARGQQLEIESVPKSKVVKRRTTWRELLKRVFQIDLSVCGACGGEVVFEHVVMRRVEIEHELGLLGMTEAPD